MGCFSPFPYGTGSLSISKEYLALPDGAGSFRQDFSGPALLRIPLQNSQFPLTGLSPAMAQLSRRFSLISVSKCGPTTPRQHATMVWALPFSLATTRGIIIIFFSSRYLDVSVPWVGSPCGVMHLQCTRLSHSEIQGYIACVQLPLAYRSLPRPSSPLRVKASTIRPYLL